MITYLLQVSTCWIVFYAIYMIFLQKETFFNINRYFLLGTFIVGLAIPFLGELMPANQASADIYQVMNHVTAIEIMPNANAGQSIFSWLKFLYFIYYAVASIVFIRFMYGLSRIHRIYKNAKKTIFKNYTLVESSKYHLPFSFFRFIFISTKLPLNKNIEKVLKHEELHANQWHSLDIVMLELLQVFFWFNPILIFYKKALKQSHEYLADAYVTKDHNKHSYGQLLLRQSTSGLEIALANHFFHSQIKKRITMMYQEKSKRPAMVKYLAAIPVLIGLLVLFASSKTNDKSRTDFKDCLTLEISNNGNYIHQNQSITYAEIETLLKKESTPNCINLNVKPVNKVSVITPILDLASNLKIPVYIVDLVNESEENAPFNGRKIIEGNQSYDINANGIISILAEADKQGNIVYAEILKGETTIEDKASHMQLLKAIKSYKIEPGKSSSHGKLTFNFSKIDKNVSLVTASQDLFGAGDVVKKHYQDQNDPIFKVVEEMPRFPGCEKSNQTLKEKDNCAKQEMLNFIYKNLTYPQAARDADIGGICIIQFIVEKDGAITNGNIVRDIGGGCGEESLNAINSMPTWIPGRQRGQEVRVQYTLPVKFKLEGKTEIEKEKKLNNINIVAHGLVKDGPEEKLTYLDSPLKSSDKIVSDIDKRPLFPGTETVEQSLNKMLEFVFKNITYPEKAKQNNIEGLAIVKFVITEKGKIQKAYISKSVGWGIDKEVMVMVEKMKQIESPWTPAVLDGKNVNYEYVLPVKFKLQEEELKQAQTRKLVVDDFNISPNPSNGEFTLSFDIEEKSPVDIKFYSMNGQLLKTLNNVSVPFTKTIDLSEIQGQSIFVNILQKNRLYTDKIIIQ